MIDVQVAPEPSAVMVNSFEVVLSLQGTVVVATTQVTSTSSGEGAAGKGQVSSRWLG